MAKAAFFEKRAQSSEARFFRDLGGRDDGMFMKAAASAAYDSDGGYGRVAELNEEMGGLVRGKSMKKHYAEEAAKARKNAERFKKGEIKRRPGGSVFDSPYAPEGYGSRPISVGEQYGSPETHAWESKRLGKIQKGVRNPKERARIAAKSRAMNELSEIGRRQADLETPGYLQDRANYIRSNPKNLPPKALRKEVQRVKKVTETGVGEIQRIMADAARSTPGTRGYRPEGPAAEAVKKVPMRLPEKKKQRPSKPRITVTPEVRDGGRPHPKNQNIRVTPEVREPAGSKIDFGSVESRLSQAAMAPTMARRF